MYFFKVWDVEKKKKTFVIIRKENDVYEDLILERNLLTNTSKYTCADV